MNKMLDPGEMKEYVMCFNKLVDALMTLDDMLYIIDVETLTPVFTTTSLLLMLGYSKPQIKALGPHWSKEITHPEDYQYLTEHASGYKDFTPTTRSRVVYRVKDPVGKWHLVESIDVALVSRENDKVSLVIGITRDLQKYGIADMTRLGEAEQYSHRCVNCRKLLGKELAVTGSIEVKCARCGEFNRIRTEHSALHLSVDKK